MIAGINTNNHRNRDDTTRKQRGTKELLDQGKINITLNNLNN